MDFEWDPGKAATNLRKHGVDFEDALKIFAGTVKIRPDLRRDYGEDRFIAIGDTYGVCLEVIFVIRDGRHRLVSAWKAGHREKTAYRADVAG